MNRTLKILPAILIATFTILPSTHGMPLKFDFGTENSLVFPGFTRVSDKTLQDKDAAFGFVETAPRALDQLRPNPLQGDFVYAKGKTTFRVQLPNGKYKAWFLYGHSRYGQRVLNPLPMGYQIGINGKNVVDDRIKDWREFFSEEHFFRGYSYVYHAGDDFYTKYVAPNFKQATVTFEVDDGHADFVLQDVPLCAMRIDPLEQAAQAEYETAYLQKELRRYTLIREVAPAADHSEPAYSAQDKKQGFVTYSRSNTSPPSIRDRPLPEEINSEPSVFLAKNQKANLSLSILPLKDLEEVKITVSDLREQGSGAVIAAADIDVHYVAHQEVNVGNRRTQSPAYTYQVKPVFIKPLPASFERMDQGINRTVLLAINPHPGTQAGKYRGTLSIAPGNAPAKQVRIEAQILPINLPPLSIPAGRYAMDSCFYYTYYWSKAITDESFLDYVWERQKQNMQWAKDNGLTSIAWSDDMRGDIRADPMRFKEDSRFVRWMDLYRDMGFQTMPWYGFQSLTSSSANMQKLGKDRFSPQWTANYRQLIETVRDLGKERNWPEVLFYLSDELSNHREEGAADGLKRATASAGILGIRRIASVNGPFERALIGKIEILMPNFAFPITPEILKEMEEKNSQLWLYNVTDTRFTWGFYPFRTDARGRFQWFNSTGNCFPFDDFDSGYGDTVFSSFVVGPDGPVSLINTLNMRDGLDDFRYLTLLKQLLGEAKDSNSPSYREAQDILAAVARLDVDLRNYAGSGMTDPTATGFDASAKLWSPEKCQGMRWRMAQAILGLQDK